MEKKRDSGTAGCFILWHILFNSAGSYTVEGENGSVCIYKR